jgi:large subunit ribosomal protein L4
MPTVAIKTKGGASAGEIALSERVFGAKVNIPLMHQAVKAELENSRQDTRNAPGRGDMLGGGKKPFKQKGTGRARQGSTVAPHWRKGGAAHGPHPRDLGHALPKKMRRAAIRAALSAKLADGELIVVDAFPLDGAVSTKTAAAFLKEVAPTAKKSLVIIEAGDDSVHKSLRNIANVTIRTAPVFSTRDVINGGIVIITRAAAEKVEATWDDGKPSTAAVAAETTPKTEGGE